MDVERGALEGVGPGNDEWRRFLHFFISALALRALRCHGHKVDGGGAGRVLGGLRSVWRAWGGDRLGPRRRLGKAKKDTAVLPGNRPLRQAVWSMGSRAMKSHSVTYRTGSAATAAASGWVSWLLFNQSVRFFFRALAAAASWPAKMGPNTCR